MTDHTNTPTKAYSEAELNQFKAEDFSAGKAVVVLMLSIFTTGVLIYSVVAYWVVSFSRS